jgi:hypothetical protein
MNSPWAMPTIMPLLQHRRSLWITFLSSLRHSRQSAVLVKPQADGRRHSISPAYNLAGDTG